MDPIKGDERIEWDPDATTKEGKKKLKQARERFEHLVEGKNAGEGAIKYHAYRVERVPRRVGEPVTEFDPDAGEYILVPQMAGGC